MTFEEIKNYSLLKNGATIDFPFDETTMTITVGKKIFLLSDINSDFMDLRINLKCNPFIAEDLRLEYNGVIPGYHMNKKHWNTVYVNKDVPEIKVKELIDHSYTLVFNSLTKKQREHIDLIHASEAK